MAKDKPRKGNRMRIDTAALYLASSGKPLLCFEQEWIKRLDVSVEILLRLK